MTSGQLDEERIFQIARQLVSPQARSEYLDQVCAGDQALRERVEGLLEVHEQEQSFLKSEGAVEPTVDQSPISEGPGHQIGRYKLLQQIGEGGFGVVYMAEQSRPVRRKVALKIIKPGMDTHAVVARFEAERQALAMMDHVNIARVLDGGTTESGRPYFVMELVKGVPITEYCDKNQLTTEERLKLFMTVCQAVQHAHQKGIIHRDLKPSNILATLHDGEPVIKVIDFGVAKAINQQLTEKTLFTAFGQMVGTPQYMSPEQAEMSGLDVDTRSDIYSLGVLLYELLTGTTPLESERLKTAGYAEMQRLIREEDPPKPSTRLSSSGEELTVIAKHRSLSPEQLQKAVRGDLDWIVMKALEKDRSRRYESASSFAEDVGRFMNFEPVEACPPTSSYQLRKFMRRNRTLLVTILGVGLVLISATITSCWFAWRATRSQQELRIAATEIQEVLIEAALMQAVAGEVDEVERILSEYEDRLGGEKWLPTLKGIAYFHSGENQKAIAQLEPIFRKSEGNTAAEAMLAVAYVHEGRWEDGLALANKFRIMSDADQIQHLDDLEKLFVGYAFLYLDYGTSSQILTDVLDRHPTWAVARAFRAGATAHASEESDAFDAMIAVEEMNAVRPLFKDNAYVQMIDLFVRKKAIEQLARRNEPTATLVQQADRVVRELRENHPRYQTANLIAAQYFEMQGKRSLAQQTWSEILDARSGWAWAAAAYLYQTNDTESTLNRIGRVGEREPLQLLIARGYVLCDIPNGRGEAMRIFDYVCSHSSSNYIRFKAVQIPLLLGETELAQTRCREWCREIDEGKLDTQSVIGEENAIRLVAYPQRLVIDDSDSSRVTRLCLAYQRGILAIARNDREEAAKHFALCQQIGHVNLDINWASAFYAKLGDPEWPRGNRLVHPDSNAE